MSKQFRNFSASAHDPLGGPASTDEETLNKQKKAMNPKEVIALYNACRTPRDRAMILVMVNSVAPNEFCQIARRWQAWFKPDVKAPLRIEVVRTKKKFSYHVTLFEEAVDSIKELYNARLHELQETERANSPLQTLSHSYLPPVKV